ncbi:MAG: YqzL family protein [Clostridia bacterium]|nr:YqzL family protein [Clostridia bacterium]
MLKEFVWKTFENTGDVNYYMFYREIEEKNRKMSESSAADEAAVSNLMTNTILA